jgi:hypothetical protein
MLVKISGVWYNSTKEWGLSPKTSKKRKNRGVYADAD